VSDPSTHVKRYPFLVTGIFKIFLLAGILKIPSGLAIPPLRTHALRFNVIDSALKFYGGSNLRSTFESLTPCSHLPTFVADKNRWKKFCRRPVNENTPNGSV